MRNIISALLLTLCASSGFAVVADGDLRPHPTITDVLGVKNAAVVFVARAVVERLVSQYNLQLFPGYKPAVIIFKDGSRAIVANDVNVTEPLLSLIGAGNLPVNVLVSQNDQSKPLAQLVDVVKPDSLATPPETTVANKNEQALPPGMKCDPLDPASSIIATPLAMQDLGKKLGLNIKPAFHIAKVTMKMPIANGGGTLTIATEEDAAKHQRGELIGLKDGSLTALIEANDGHDMPTTCTVEDVIVQPNAPTPVTP
jgi:hypothetical protein